MRCASTLSEHFPSRFAVVAMLLCRPCSGTGRSTANRRRFFGGAAADSCRFLAGALPQPRANQYSSNELLDAGHHFFGDISHGLASIVEKAVSQWGLPNGYILGEEASGAFIGGLRYGEGRFIRRMPGTCACSGRGPRWASTMAPTARGP